MTIHHQGWSDHVGAFNCDATIDENKSDHVIYFRDGSVGTQQTAFQDLVLDWDQDGKPYPKVGAFFDYRGETEFFTPRELASLALTGDAEIPGIRITDRQPRLEDRLQAANRRAKAQADIRQAQQNRSFQPSKRQPEPTL